uniref:Protein kinase domain-containing protein n=1 Tax=Bursaphelenchus xylophilus TaxID=6326 RepID=A0A1I7RKY3_BURXY
MEGADHLGLDISGKNFFSQIGLAVGAVAIDKRDPWPASQWAYFNVETLRKGEFGNVSLVQTKINHPMSGIDIKRCILKTINLEKQFKKIVHEAGTSEDNKSTALSRVMRLLRRTVMDLYVIGRCRHQNILHAHSVFLNEGNLMIAMPRFHVLQDLIEDYRQAVKNDPISMTIIAPIIRQLCQALDFLQKIGIIHRDVQPNNVLLTRNGTAKLCHFGQSKVLSSKKHFEECKTPVGKEEFMCAEKLCNLVAFGLENCRSYDYAADIWSLGVMILSMVSYFPNESHHRLHRNFALIMEEEQASFIWLTAEMVQLRARLLKSGGNELKSFLSDFLLNPNSQKRPVAEELINHPKLLSWCSDTIEKDKATIKKLFIDRVDFANKSKIQRDGMNFDFLECKDIPAEFYWNDDWKRHDSECFSVTIVKGYQQLINTEFRYFNPDQLLSPLFQLVESGSICFGDLIPIRALIDDMTFDLIRTGRVNTQRDGNSSIEKKYSPHLGCDVNEPSELVVRVGFGSLTEEEETALTGESFESY